MLPYKPVVFLSCRITAPLKNIVAFDCEMVGCYPTEEWPVKRKKSKEVSVAAQCAVVDYDCNIIYNSFIAPPENMRVTPSGWRCLKPADVMNGTPFQQARSEILSLLKDKIVVVHDIRHDIASLQICLGQDILPQNVRDTSTCQLLREIAGVPAHYPHASLTALAKSILKWEFKEEFLCDPAKDAELTMKLYRYVENKWEKEQ